MLVLETNSHSQLQGLAPQIAEAIGHVGYFPPVRVGRDKHWSSGKWWLVITTRTFRPDGRITWKARVYDQSTAAREAWQKQHEATHKLNNR